MKLSESVKKRNTKEHAELTEASNIIDDLKKYLGLNEDYFAIMSVWQQEIGNSNVILNGYKDGIIFACTKSSAHLNDINLRKNGIIKKLNQYLGRQAVKNIKCEIK